MGKKFIDKKNATTYKLVYRSQEDPNAFEQGMSDRVFVEVKKKGAAKTSAKGKEPQAQTLQQSLMDLNLGISEQDLAQDEAGQAALYGVYLDDRDYDYTKHLRPVGSGGGVILEAPGKKERPAGVQFVDGEEAGDGLLPAEVLPSMHRMDIKSEAFPTGPQPFMDRNLREVLEALEEDEQVDELDDDFLDRLNADQPPSDAEDAEDSDEGGFYDQDDDEDFDPDDVFAQVRRMKERQLQMQRGSADDDDMSEASGPAYTEGTGFSMSSSAMFRNDKLTLLDEHFDKIEAMYERDETDSEDERYDSDGHHRVEYDAEGNAKPISTRPDFESVMDEFLSEYELTGKRMQVVVEGGDGAGKLDTVRQAFLKATQSAEASRRELLDVGNRIIDEDNRRTDKDEAEYFDRLFQEKQRTPWDCQTILTTYSTLDNHPATIYEQRTPRIRVSRKTGLPLVENAAAEDGPHEDREEDEEEQQASRENMGKARSKGETSEEKRARKKMLQEAKRERRDQKKETRGAFAEKHDRKMQSRKDRAQYVVRLD
ncbi:Protein ltv1 [Coemansia interrupta]|uniref:Protein ltv1 n=1 Tax=Coemansia interrupta TaxID=1126814 RepID=A0A9W8HFI7_9FUNG|nr:Protein ltv1 [Coemansia interrupta]